MPEDPPEIDSQLSPRDLKQNYKNWKESTSTSLSGRYLNLYKTWIHVPEEEEYTGITSVGFFQMINNIITVTTDFNHPLQSWSIAHNLYKLKKQ
eukprot:15323979-Ditylum_brightwellii.AAC.1